MRVRVNPITCEAHGLCAEMLPEWVQLDEWGYPVIDGDPLPHQLTAHARAQQQPARLWPSFSTVTDRGRLRR
jgi:ferredoxin